MNSKIFFREVVNHIMGATHTTRSKSIVPYLRVTYRCQNRRISGRGSRTVHQGRMVTGDKGHDVFTQVRALSMEVIPYSCLINIDDMGSTRIDLPRDHGG